MEMQKAQRARSEEIRKDISDDHRREEMRDEYRREERYRDVRDEYRAEEIRDEYRAEEIRDEYRRDEIRDEYRREEIYDDYWDYYDYDYRVEVDTVYTTSDFNDYDCEATVIVDGVTYYGCDGVWYKRAYSGGRVVYVVVEGPRNN